MGSYGWHNPWPFEWGGGPTQVERVYTAMRGAVGRGGSAPNDDGTLEGLWRQMRARAIASVGTFGERAAMQNFPSKATDALPYYEQLLLLTPGPDDTIEDRNVEASDGYTRQIRSATPDVETLLEGIDSRFSILEPTVTGVTQRGRSFEDLAATEPFGGGRKSTDFPNYSDDFVLFVFFDIGSGVLPSPAEQRIIGRAETQLREVLPAWVVHQVTTDDEFILDRSLLDLSGLNP